MPLDEYKKKRHFDKTPEPAAAPKRKTAAHKRNFVIQKHDASRLHYDFRLELDGVMVSWAVPKGPSLDTHDKRLAMHVEDHPLAYASFEGIIPEGEYGAGTVIVWDRGWWEPLPDAPRKASAKPAAANPAKSLADGALKFRLHGEKLHGGWALVRLKQREGDHGESWLLIKERDEFTRAAADYDVLKELPDSVATARSLEQVAEEESGPSGSTYHSNRPARSHPRTTRTHGASPGDPPKDPFPADAPLELATLVKEPPEGEDWIHEVKYDGYRIKAVLNDGRLRLLTRNELDWTSTFTTIAEAIDGLPVESAILDGEVVAFDAAGVTDFGTLQDAIATKKTERLAYVVFDLLYLEGHDLRKAALLKRKELLQALLETQPTHGVLRYADHVTEGGVHFHAEACAHGLEGSVSKRGSQSYIGSRTRDWLKVRCSHEQEFVIGGFTEPGGSRQGLGSLLLGVYASKGELRYAGRVGTGFNERTLLDLRKALDKLETDEPPFMNPPRQDGKVHWVKPRLVGEVAFKEWTRDGVVRQPSFQGLRKDKAPEDVTFEVAEEGAGGGGGSGAADDTGSSATGASAAATTGGKPRAGGKHAFGRDVTVAGVKITNPDKLLFEDSQLTKIELVYYYEKVAPFILPHIANRPLTLVRCPIGRGKGCFYQKHPDLGVPDTLKTVTIEEREGPALYMWLNDIPGLLSLAQLGVLEIHTWGSCVKSPYKPDRLIFDLDPGPGVEWKQIVGAAFLLRERLEKLGFTPFVKTTGGKGLHVVIPVKPSLTYNEARPWAKSFVDSVVAEDPDSLVGKMAKNIRAGKIFVDYVRNAQGATAVAPYSTRARPGAPIAVPIEWDELREKSFDPKAFTAETVLQRLGKIHEDPWAAIEKAQASARTLRAAASASS